MKNIVCLRKEVFPGSDIIRKYAFKNMLPGEKSARLAKFRHMLTAVPGTGRDSSAHFSKKNQVCFECLSSRKDKAV